MSRRSVIVLAALFSLALLLSGGAAHSCLNDRDSDSLAAEARDLPELPRVITGRFERNPPLFYQMRVERVAAELQATPDKFPLYDDIAVALDRLGRSGEAITWIEKKRTRLVGTKPIDPEFRDAWYRYYANVGTFRVHRWLRDGADRARLAEVRQARDEIAKAILINPNAHFGRETYQLQAIEWMLDPGNTRVGLRLREKPGQRIETGLAGLVVLGNAWESPDVFAALARHLRSQGRNKLAYVAWLRAAELIDAGRRPLFAVPGSTPDEQKKVLRQSGLSFRMTGVDTVSVKYRELRRDAEDWHAKRETYMNSHLAAGGHPDTDPMFWRAWAPAPPPALDTDWRDDAGENFGNFVHRAFALAPILLPLALFGAWLLVRAVRAWRGRY